MKKNVFFALFSLITCATFAQGGASKKKETATSEYANKSVNAMCDCFNKHVTGSISPESQKVVDKLVKNKVTDENKIATTLTETELEVLMQELDKVDSNDGFLNCIDEAGTKIGGNVALMEKAKAEHPNPEAFDKALETEMMKQMSSLKSCSTFFYFFLLASKE